MKVSTGIGFFIVAALACKGPSKTTTISGEDLSAYRKKNEGVKALATPVPATVSGKADGSPKKEKRIAVPDPIQTKYAGYLNTAPENIRNLQLYQFIDRWLHTPYKWGGMDERGIDCSAFLQKLFSEVYLINIPRTSVEQFYTDRVDKFQSSKYLSEGDLVFFHTISDRPISHVGLYLQNGMFVNSSSSKGVSIASLNDPYWRKRYVASGRIKNF